MGDSPHSSVARRAQSLKPSALKSTEEFLATFGASGKHRYARLQSGALGEVQGAFYEAVQHHRAGRLDEAVAGYRRVLALRPDRAEAHNNLGAARVAQGRFDEAVAHYERALAVKPNYADAHRNLGSTFAAQGRMVEAVAHYEHALVLKPECAVAHNDLGVALAAQGRIVEAAAHYKRALALNPDCAVAHNNLGVAFVTLGRIHDALTHYERAVVLKPDYARAHNNLGVVLAALGRIDDAVAHYERALALQPDYAEAHGNLGIALAALGKIDGAVASCARTLVLKPNHAEAHNSLGNILRSQGKFDDAMAHFGRAIAIRPDYAEAHFNRADIKTFRDGDPDLTALETLAGRDGIPASKMPFIHFALAKALEDSGDYRRGFEHLRKGNDSKRKQIDYDEAAVLDLFQRITDVFHSDLFSRLQGAGDPSPVPIFVLGMPRSGSTLIEQILASHPQIHGAGELTDLGEAASAVMSARDPLGESQWSGHAAPYQSQWSGHAAPYQSQWSGHAAPYKYPEGIAALDGAAARRMGQSYLARLPVPTAGKVRIVDKLPGNFFYIGLIRLILPNARIIHSVRNPLDTCVSCYSKLFTSGQDFTYDLAELGRYYRSYRKLMVHWRSVLSPGAMLEVAYEDVVNELEGEARRLIDYCGLPWDDRCLSFHRTSRLVRTASDVQVRKPLFRNSLERWRKYEDGIASLLDELGDILPSHASRPCRPSSPANAKTAFRP
jgi:tetratricopeptide (TPR) repeat protein